MRSQILHSIKSLTHYINPSEIIVFITPPSDPKDIDLIDELGVELRFREHVSNSFSAFERNQHYADKWLLTQVESDAVLFLDCDTLIFDNPMQLFSGKSFRAREGNATIERGAWRKLFDKYSEPYFNWMPNTGVLVFDNGFHHDIAEKWATYLNKDLPKVHDNYHKEQLALTLALAGHNADQLSPREHVFEWTDIPPSDAVVYHLDTSQRVGLQKELEIKYRSLKSKFGW